MNSDCSRGRAVLSVACAVVLVAVGGVVSFVSAAPVQARDLEEVVVTAQKRAESLQDVPIAISALDQSVIEKTDTHGLADIAVQVPGLSYTPFSPGQNIVSLRGVASNDDGAGTDSSVAIFVDDVYLGRISNINPEMFDLERIEVLRGPQGTLYGKNTMGGALNIVSTRPNLDEFEGKVKLNLGNYSRFDAAGLFTGPLSESWAAKLSFSRRKHNGWVDNPTLNQAQKNDDTTAYRLQFLYDGSDVDLLFSADYNDLDILDMGRVPAASNYNNNRGGANPATFRAGFEAVCGNVSGRDCVAGAIDGYARRTGRGVSAKVNWTINDIFEFVSITAFRDSHSDWNMDSTGSPDLELIDDILDETDQFSQEFRLLGDVSDFWNFVAGFWFLRERTDRAECFDLNRVPGTDCTVVNADGTNDGSDYYRQSNETESAAVFAQFDLNFTEEWQLSLGARLTEETKSISNIAIAGNFVIINNTFQNEKEETWSAFTPKVTLRYAPWNHTSFYLSITEGFKSGGFAAAPQAEIATEPLDQEEALNFEIGVKSDPRANFRIAAALYRTDYEGLQIQAFGPRPDCVEDPNTMETECFGEFRTFNAGDAEVIGLDVESTWLPTDNMLITWFVGIMDSEFGETNVPNSPFSNQDGQDLIRTPELKYGFAMDYTLPFSGGSQLVFGVSHTYVDDQRNELAPYAIQYAYRLWDARLTWISPHKSVELTAWGKNMADEEYIAHLYTIAGSVTAVYGDPRMYGVSGTFRF